MWAVEKALFRTARAQSKFSAADGSAADRLQLSDLHSQKHLLAGLSGIPATADSCAYEPIQRLLAVATSDGRIKILGQEGVERVLLSTRGPKATREMQFLYNRAVLVRLCRGGSLELFAVEDLNPHSHTAPLQLLQLDGDEMTTVAPLKREPYLLLGCLSGNIKVAMLVNASGSAITEARQVKGLKLLQYEVTAEAMGASGLVTSLCAYVHNGQQRVLAVHSFSGATVWDLRSQRVVGQVNPTDPLAITAVRNAGDVTSGCWLNPARCEFATGHQSGDIFVWCIVGDGGQSDAVLVTPMKVVQGGATLPVQSLQYVSGRREGLLVCGGGSEDHPPGLVLLPLSHCAPEGEAEVEDVVDNKLKLPWFGSIKGFCLVPARGAITGYEDPSAVVVLTEGGELIVQELGVTKPQHITLPFQAAMNVTATSLCSVPARRLPVTGLKQLSAALLRMWGAAGAHKGGKHSWRWALKGGRPAAADPDAVVAQVYLTGHGDGCVRLWDMYGQVPLLLGALPSAAAAQALPEPRAVTAVHLAWEHSLLFTGHEKGEVRVSEFMGKGGARGGCVSIECIGTRAPSNTVLLSEPAGFQLKMRSTVHPAAITCFAFSQRLLVAGDAAGGVSLLDMNQAAVLWYQQHSASPLVGLAMGTCPVPGPKDRNEALDQLDVHQGQHHPCVYTLTADSSIGVLEQQSGHLLSRHGMVKPKHSSSALLVELLDEDGLPLWLAADIQALHSMAQQLQQQQQQEQDESCRESPEPAAAAPAAARSPATSAALSPLAAGAAHSPFSSARSLQPHQLEQEQQQEQDDGSVSEQLQSDADASSAHSLSRQASRKMEASMSRASTAVSEVHSSPTSPAAAAAAGEEEEEPEYDASSPIPEDEEDEADVDALLAAAAAQVDLNDRQTVAKKRRNPLGRLLGSRAGSKTEPPRSSESLALQADRLAAAGGGGSSPSSPRGSKARRSSLLASLQLKKSQALPEEDGPRSPTRQQQQQHLSEELPLQQQRQQSAPLEPTVSAVEPVFEEAHQPGVADVAVTVPERLPSVILVASQEHLRLYDVRTLSSGDRSTLRKVQLVGQLLHAATFQLQGSPGLCCLLRQPSGALALQVFALPSLTQLLEVPLPKLLQCDWKWDARFDRHPGRVFSSSRHGHVALLGRNNELARLVLGPACEGPCLPAAMYDWDMAAAANAAGAFKARQSDAASSSQQQQEEHGHVQRPRGKSGIAGLVGKALGGAASGFAKIAQNAQTVLQLSGDMEREQPQQPQQQQQQQSDALPSLEAVFSRKAAAADSSSSRDSMEQRRQPAAAAEHRLDVRRSVTDPEVLPSARVAATSSGRAAPSAAGGSGLAGTYSLDMQRAQLLGPTSPTAARPRQEEAGSSATRVRSADEIRAAYGRPARKASELRSVMEDTREALAERGEKLAQLQDKTADLEQSAMSFAQMAKKIAQQQQNKKWWQL